MLSCVSAVQLHCLCVFALLASASAASPTSKRCVFTPAMDPSADGFRNFEIENRCGGELRVNFQGQTFYNGGETAHLPENGGFRLPSGDTKTVAVSERTFSMRIWARQNCKERSVPVQGAGLLWCDAGNCPIPPGGSDETCRAAGGAQIGGIPPSSVIELTLCGGRGGHPQCYGPEGGECKINNWGPPISDYYDVSSVDGPTIAVSIEPQNFDKVNDSHLDPRFNCGAPAMKTFDYTECPHMLRLGNDGKNYADVKDTVGCLSPCAFAAQFQDQWKSLFNNDTAKAAHEKAHVCCECGEGHGSCEDNCAPNCGKAKFPDAKPNLACIAGCSPYAGYPDSFASTFCYLKDYPNVTDPRSGKEVALSSVPTAFKRQNPQAYSWQFDDLSSTYMCDLADYKVIFCGDEPPHPPSPSPTPGPPAPTPPPSPLPPPSPSPSPPTCKLGQSVHCPGGDVMCAGNSCCPDGSTCPSADEDFAGCPKKKSEDCLGEIALIV